jgi:hypothetical protein
MCRGVAGLHSPALQSAAFISGSMRLRLCGCALALGSASQDEIKSRGVPLIVGRARFGTVDRRLPMAWRCNLLTGVPKLLEGFQAVAWYNHC